MTATPDLVSAIDALMREAYPPTEPGAAVIAVRDGETILRAGYGMAHLELGVPIEPDMVFRLGSITKQITAVAILMLMEQGLLQLDDPITTFIPDYPTHAHTITIEHLLTHTSGIQSYTDMPSWDAVWRKDFTVPELIDFFKHQPMQFAPGTRWAYNNSAYFLLGAVIEKVSGKPYEQFLQEQIFAPLGMRQTAYDRPLPIVPRRAAGYSKGPDGYTNAEYLSMTQPHAAGAIASTVDDLARWDASLTACTLVSAESLARAWEPYQLADGKRTGYGYGWAVSSWQGSRIIEHGGGIHGFVTFALRMPEERTFVALLSNNAGGRSPEFLALQIAAHLIGRPYAIPAPIALSPEALPAYAGTYQMPDGVTWTVAMADGRLTGQWPDGPPLALVPTSRTEFYVEGNPLLQLRFSGEAGTPMTAVAVWHRAEPPSTAKRIEAPAPAV
jgi:D-alanyl-D-alanine carboxypeptidase